MIFVKQVKKMFVFKCNSLPYYNFFLLFFKVRLAVTAFRKFFYFDEGNFLPNLSPYSFIRGLVNLKSFLQNKNRP